MHPDIIRCCRLLALPGLVVLFVSLATGCASLDRRIAHHQPYFGSLPAEKQAAIRQGKIDVGYTKADVYIAKGNPDVKYTRTTAKGELEVWAWWDYDDEPYFWGRYRGHHAWHRGYYPIGGDPWDWPYDPYYTRWAREYLRVIFDQGVVLEIERRDRY